MPHCQDSTTRSIGTLSRETSVKVETIRYYEHAGLLPEPPRSPGGHRLYGEAHVKRLSFIRRARELGFPLSDVRELLALADGTHNGCEEAYAITQRQAAIVQRKIDDLQRIERSLLEMADACHKGTPTHCPILDNLFEGSKERD